MSAVLGRAAALFPSLPSPLPPARAPFNASTTACAWAGGRRGGRARIGGARWRRGPPRRHDGSVCVVWSALPTARPPPGRLSATRRRSTRRSTWRRDRGEGRAGGRAARGVATRPLRRRACRSEKSGRVRHYSPACIVSIHLGRKRALLDVGHSDLRQRRRGGERSGGQTKSECCDFSSCAPIISLSLAGNKQTNDTTHPWPTSRWPHCARRVSEQGRRNRPRSIDALSLPITTPAFPFPSPPQRAEHNDGALSTLTDASLHQLHLTRVTPLLNAACPRLTSLSLAGNALPTFPRLPRLRELADLNLALNAIVRVRVS